MFSLTGARKSAHDLSVTDDELLSEAYGWLSDCFEDCPDRSELTDSEIRVAVDRHYDGGFWQLAQDCQ